MYENLKNKIEKATTYKVNEIYLKEGGVHLEKMR